ncbi:monovalent cation/H+ antiporter subunit D [Bartonella sp. HY038]|uniref:monovalent cation/H+ antiporter subunit D n=1 Tax=Bartonella sp. HY038 TaxID=2759660 RepID=UPI0015F9FF5E|nr:monovalent cation/H+ antiporter subunit D [Bartonella sp. HY038]
MGNALYHLIIIPIILPLAVAAVLLFFDERRHTLKLLSAIITSGLLVLVAIALIARAKDITPSADVYLLGNWAAPFGIVLVLDRLSAVLLLLSSCLMLGSLVYSYTHWNKAGPHFPSLMLFLLAGVNGAFLTGDLFNLFVFFEVMLTASYALALHGSGSRRVRAGLHYIVINLLASSLFLIGAALIYGVTGTLNMADIAAKLSAIPANDLMLFEAGAAILGVAFLVKAGMWPLSFWLPATYSAAPAPVAAVFAILSKVGIYVILRLSILIFGASASSVYGFGHNVLFYGGLVTIVFGIFGVLASQALSRLASYCILVSSGTLIATIGTGNEALIGPAVFYLITSTLALGAFFLLVELIERGQDSAANVLAVTMEVYGDEEEEEEDEVGLYLPATVAILGSCFAVCAILIIGMPPFSGFLAKIMLISGQLNAAEAPTAKHFVGLSDWLYVAAIILSGVAALIAMTRAGIRTFWASLEGSVPRVMVIEIAPIAGLLLICLLLTIIAGPTMRYMDVMGESLFNSYNYIGSVLGGVNELSGAGGL